MKPLQTILLALVAMTAPVCVAAERMPRCTPEEQGIPSQAIEALLDSLLTFEHTDLHSLVVTRNGCVVAEAYAAPFHENSSQQMYSCSKTFVGLAVGLAIEDNLLRLDDRAGAILPEALPTNVSDSLAAITVRDLLTMQSGLKVDWGMRSRRDDWLRGYFSQPMTDMPGRRFGYDSMSSYALAAIVQRVTGRTVLDYIAERILRPMGITDARWEVSPEGINCGGWGVWMQPESLAKIGQLFLQKGRWEGRQLVAEDWIAQMTEAKVPQDSPTLDDYCYQMWTCRRPGTSRLDGALGQFVFIVPDLQMVVVVTQSFTGDGYAARREQSWLWDGLMPAVADEPLPPSRQYKHLQKSLSQAALPMPQGKASSPRAASLDGRTLSFEPNPLGWSELSFDTDGALRLNVTASDGSQTTLQPAYGKWQREDINYAPANSLHSVHDALRGLDVQFEASSSYAWTAPDTLVVKIYYTNWGSATTLTISVGDDGPTGVSATYNWSPNKSESLKLR